MLGVLSTSQIASFQRDGFVPIRGAVPRSVVDECIDVVWEKLAVHGVRRDDPGTWTSPVVRIDCPEDADSNGPFVRAGTSPALWEAYDQLIGPGRWWRWQGVGGTIPVRFPHQADPQDASWHIEMSFLSDDTWRANVRSRDRGLLALFLFTGVGPDDAPTRVRVGSHVDAARVLAPFGDQGLDHTASAPLVEKASTHRPVALATGAAGDVYLCHPFLVHAASWPHRGVQPRIIAQPGVALLEPFSLTGRSRVSPVEAAILDALAR